MHDEKDRRERSRKRVLDFQVRDHRPKTLQRSQFDEFERHSFRFAKLKSALIQKSV